MCTEELTDILVNEIIESRPHDHMALLPPAIEKEKIKCELVDEIKAFINRITEAVELLKKHIDAPDHLEELKKIGRVSWGSTQWNNDRTYKEIAGISENSMRSYREVAIQLYNKEEYRSAANVFFLLSLLDWKLTYYWNSLGHAEYYAENYAEAIKAYEAASKLDPTDPKPLFYTAHCYEMRHDIPLAIDTLLESLSLINSDPFHKHWEPKIKDYLQELRSRYDTHQ